MIRIQTTKSSTEMAKRLGDGGYEHRGYAIYKDGYAEYPWNIYKIDKDGKPDFCKSEAYAETKLEAIKTIDDMIEADKLYGNSSATEGPISFVTSRVNSGIDKLREAAKGSKLGKFVQGKVEKHERKKDAKISAKSPERAPFHRSNNKNDLEVEKTGSKNTSWSPEKAKQLDAEYQSLGTSGKSKMIDEYFPVGILTSKSLLKAALDKKQSPFRSYLYQTLINYEEKAKGADISDENAKSLIDNERVLGKILEKHGTSGLNLASKSNFQLKAISWITNNNFNINLRGNGTWLSEKKMKEAISSYKMSEKEKVALDKLKKVDKGPEDNTELFNAVVKAMGNARPDDVENLRNLSKKDLAQLLNQLGGKL